MAIGSLTTNMMTYRDTPTFYFHGGPGSRLEGALPGWPKKRPADYRGSPAGYGTIRLLTGPDHASEV
ncbi:MAG: hypothetical protein IBX40_08980 [Methanosarcinales archaeon]|nr:hypothetical protein [Methanosarcinales archaeon]